MTNHYKNSWDLYKAQTEEFVDDFEYYLHFCKGFKSLDIFAGFGRLTNFLFKKGVDIEAVELEPNFANFIEIPPSKIHVCDVLDFSSSYLFERIIAGFNSFCLFTDDNSIKKFFSKLSSLLTKEGKISLSYYHHDFWENSTSYTFNCKGEKIYYEPDYDFSNRDSQGIGIWIDRYKNNDLNLEFKYPTKIYENIEQLKNYLTNSDLFIENVIKNYGFQEPNGWVEFILAKEIK